ncbi:MAG: Mut7-C RNAse domain-containing protein [Spirulina sp.]
MSNLYRTRFRFYASLNDFLPRQRRQKSFTHGFKGNPSIKDTIEALGVPHPEVELILKNREIVDFSEPVREGDRWSIYPHFSSLELPDSRLRPVLAITRFVLDVHLGKLATQMRFLGFDTLYENDYSDPELAALSQQQQRIVLTRDIALLKRSRITYGYWLRHQDPEEQLQEVLNRFALFSSISPFKRCSRCNGLMKSVNKADIQEQLEPLTRKYYHEFYQCTDCHQIYWQGSHYDRLKQWIEKIAGS